jgi:hypothetical protein
MCDSFRRQAGAVWNRTAKAAKLRLFMNEETITETALFELARKHQSGDFLVAPATKAQEAIHGGDWLWWFVHGGESLSYRVQAKRLYPSGRYESLLKKGVPDPYEQLHKLLANAAVENHIPLYCFYNFQHPDGNFGYSTDKCAHKYHPPSYWGCSLALAEDVKFANSDALKELRKFMMPWHLISCTNDSTSLIDAARAAIRTLADPKGEPKVVGDKIIWERPTRILSLETRLVPEYVREMLEIQRQPLPEMIRQEAVNDRAQNILEQYDLSGLAVFSDARPESDH